MRWDINFNNTCGYKVNLNPGTVCFSLQVEYVEVFDFCLRYSVLLIHGYLCSNDTVSIPRRVRICSTR